MFKVGNKFLNGGKDFYCVIKQVRPDTNDYIVDWFTVQTNRIYIEKYVIDHTTLKTCKQLYDKKSNLPNWF